MNKLIASIFLLTLFMIGCSPQAQQNNEAESTKREVSLQQVWATDAVFKTPESVIYDQDRNVLYVSNVNDAPAEKDGNGFISKLSLEGEVIELEWVTGMSGPKGMGIYNGKLYVTDIDELVEIDIENGTITNKYMVEEASFLNDVTIANDGTVYFSGSQSNKIYKFRNGQVEVFMDENVEGPNGLLFSTGTLFTVTNGDQKFKSIDPETKEITTLASFEGHGDGIVLVDESSFIISDWEGRIYFYNNNEMQTILNTKDQKINAADIEYLRDENLLLVPTFFDNRVVAYRLVEGVIDHAAQH
jgi:outer membrane protein assembly factor BamB